MADKDPYAAFEPVSGDDPYAGFETAKGKSRSTLQEADRAALRAGSWLTFGLNDEVVAGARSLYNGTSYWKNLKDERRKKREAFSGPMTGIDVASDTVGMTANAMLTAGFGTIKTGGELAARTAMPLAESAPVAARNTAEAIAAPVTKSQVLREGTRVGALYGAVGGYGNAQGDIPDQMNEIIASTAGGALVGRAIPSIAYGVK